MAQFLTINRNEYPEKLGLALSVYNKNCSNPIDEMATIIGLGRLHRTTKDELEALLTDAHKIIVTEAD